MCATKQCKWCFDFDTFEGDVCDACRGRTCGTCLHFAVTCGPDYASGKVRIESFPPDGWCTVGPTDRHWHWVEDDYTCNYNPSKWEARVGKEGD